MRSFTLLGFLISLALGGCVSLEELKVRQDAADDARCRSYGAQPETDGYAKCRKAVAEMRNATTSAELNAATAKLHESVAEDEALRASVPH